MEIKRNPSWDTSQSIRNWHQMLTKKKAIQFWVTETIPPRDYALLGHKDLADFVIELGSNPKLIWKNTIQENETPRSNLNSRFDSCGWKERWTTKPGETFKLEKSWNKNPILFKEVEHIYYCQNMYPIFEPIGAEPSLLHPFTVQLKPRCTTNTSVTETTCTR